MSVLPASAARAVLARALLVVALAALAGAGAKPAVAGVTLQITPATLSVPPNSDFDVKLRVTSAGSPFNAIYTFVTYDPAMLTPVPLSPIRSQIDSLFNSACAGPYFHKFRYGGGVDTIDVSMFCNGASVTGPGAIYHLRFHAGNVTGRTGIAFGSVLDVANGGIYVNPVTGSGAIVGIGVPVLDAELAPTAARPHPSVSPNPAMTEARIDFGDALRTEATLRVLDAQGRVRATARCAAGSRGWSWDGRGSDGAPAGPGLYFVEIAEAGSRRTARFVRVR